MDSSLLILEENIWLSFIFREDIKSHYHIEMRRAEKESICGNK
jgi:hypothetical protein